MSSTRSHRWRALAVIGVGIGATVIGAGCGSKGVDAIAANSTVGGSPTDSVSSASTDAGPTPIDAAVLCAADAHGDEQVTASYASDLSGVARYFTYVERSPDPITDSVPIFQGLPLTEPIAVCYVKGVVPLPKSLPSVDPQPRAPDLRIDLVRSDGASYTVSSGSSEGMTPEAP